KAITPASIGFFRLISVSDNFSFLLSGAISECAFSPSSGIFFTFDTNSVNCVNSMKNYFLYVLCIVFFVGCQDTKTKDTPNLKSKKNHKKNAALQADSTSLSAKLKKTLTEKHTAKTYRLDTITPVDQIHLKPFLEKY